MIKAGLALTLCAAPVWAETPRSAIPWLSDVLEQPAELSRPAQPVSAISDHVLSDIVVTSLDAPLRDGVGLLTPNQTGFPQDLWGPTSALRVRHLILDHPGTGVPATRGTFFAVLLAETKPPPGSTAENAVLLARIDRLMQSGHLDQAEALVELAGITDPEIFRRAFDIGLLTERSDNVCASLRASPALSPTLPARVFCLARSGDWDAAAITLGLGHDIGEIPPQQEELLARFLDPDLFDGTEDPPVPDPLTTLDFVLRDAVGLDRPSGTLPLAFEHHDLGPHSGLRQRIIAAERLVRAGALAYPVLFAAYREGKPAASGSIWEHAAAVQALDAAFAAGDMDRILTTLVAADETFQAIGLRLELAREFAPQLAELELVDMPSDTRHRVYSLLMLAEDWSNARRFMADNNDVSDTYFRALAEPGTSFPDMSVLGDLRLAAARGLTRPDAPTETAALLAQRMDQGAVGEVILSALSDLSAGTEVDPGDLESGLWLLRRAGLTGAARNIAVQTLILLPEA
ncbi:hypothetical protein [Halovulum sp. GXIMD14793]